MRLGELLVATGILSPEQVETARSRQVIHGGRIGTNSVELGYLSLDQLAEALGRQLQRPPVLEAHYDQIDRDLSNKLSPELAANWHAVPLGRTGASGEQVAIATTAPFAEDVLTELERIFEAKIVEAIAPEMRLLYWLEQIYGIARVNRFRRVDHRERDEEHTAQIEESGAERRVYVHTISEDSDIADTSQLAKIAVKRIAVQRPTGRIETATDPRDTDLFLRTVRRSTGRNRMAELVVQILREGFENKFSAGMLLLLREELLVGWKGFIRDTPDRSVEEIAIPVGAPSFLQSPCTDSDSYFGFPDSPASIDKRLWHYLGPPPQAIAVVPIQVNNELACMLYAQSGESIASEHAKLLEQLGMSVSACLSRLIRNASR